MKTVGLWGGTTWHSTLEYYRQFNEEIASRLGPQHSGRMIIHSIDFHDLATAGAAEDWHAIASGLGVAGLGVRLGGQARCQTLPLSSFFPRYSDWCRLMSRWPRSVLRPESHPQLGPAAASLISIRNN